MHKTPLRIGLHIALFPPYKEQMFKEQILPEEENASSNRAKLLSLPCPSLPLTQLQASVEVQQLQLLFGCLTSHGRDSTTFCTRDRAVVRWQ